MSEKECTAPEELFYGSPIPEFAYEISLVPEDGLPCAGHRMVWMVTGDWCEGCAFAVNRWPWDD